LISQVGFHPYRLDHTGTVIVAPAEAAPEDQNLKIRQVCGPVYQRIYMYAAGGGTGKLKSIGGLMIAVKPVSGKDQSVYIIHTSFH
jgi:hypothetical protein